MISCSQEDRRLPEQKYFLGKSHLAVVNRQTIIGDCIQESYIENMCSDLILRTAGMARCL